MASSKFLLAERSSANAWLTFVFFLATASCSLAEMTVHCPKNTTNVTLFFDFFEGSIENGNHSHAPEELEDLKGFDVNFFLQFFSICPTPYTLKPWSLDNQSEIVAHQESYGDFIFLNGLSAENYNLLQVSQPVLIFPSCVVYLKRSAQNDPLFILIHY